MERKEHPKPQFERENWMNLNGEWEFEFDFGNSGEERGLYTPDAPFSRKIQVPFCPESALSGIGYTDFMRSVWYRRKINLEKENLSGRVFLHFGAVDHSATVYVNGRRCGSHKGGYVSFKTDVTPFVREGENAVVVHAEDDIKSRLVARGKQAETYYSEQCVYTRTTGIWQTVWLEFVPETHIERVKYYPDIHAGALTILAEVQGEGVFSADAFFEGKEMGGACVSSHGGTVALTIRLKEKHLWEVGRGGLYDLRLRYGGDSVKSYFGLRSVRLDGYKFLINEVSVFQKLILDQGFYPDGIYTAPSDEALLADIERSMAMGFNGARLHEKVFEERFLYHCDKKGYIVWGEFPNWGLDLSYPDSIYGILPEWMEEVERDFNHPALIGWCPFNETWDEGGRRQFNEVLSVVYRATKALDPTRPCIDTSGLFHVCTDIFDVHDYTQDPGELAKNYESLPKDGTIKDRFADRQTYVKGTPIFVSEFGGIRWAEEQEGWGYGNAPKTETEFLERFQGQVDALLDNPCMFGFCYTQLTDVEQEQNGLYTYDRKSKFDPAKIRKILSREAAIEKK